MQRLTPALMKSTAHSGIAMAETHHNQIPGKMGQVESPSDLADAKNPAQSRLFASAITPEKHKLFSKLYSQVMECKLIFHGQINR
jgi:hypothetical protein